MPDPAARGAALAALTDLLATLFSNDLEELRFRLRALEGYADARLEIPDKQGTAPRAYMRAAVEWLEATGRVRARLFEMLVRRSPGRERDIRAVQRQLQRILLFATATPDGLAPLDVVADAAGVVEALHASFADPGWAVIVRHRVTLDDLVPLMLLFRPDVLHFSGHGDVWSRIWVEGDDDAGEQVPSGPLLRLVGGAVPPLQCVVWSACHSARLARATVKAGVPCAIGMSAEVNDLTAIQVARGLSTGLAQLQTYDQALKTGLLQAGLHRAPGLHMPTFAGDTALMPRDLT